MFRGIFRLNKKESEVKDKLAAIKVNLNLLLNRIYEMNIDNKVSYEIEQKVNELSDKVYEMADILEEIETIVEL